MRIFVKPLLNSLLVLLFLLAVKPLYGAAEPSVENLILPQPNAELQPGDVVQIVINALASNDFPYRDAGIETTFNFASPSNKLQTGPLQNFNDVCLELEPTSTDVIFWPNPFDANANYSTAWQPSGTNQWYY